MKTGTPAFIVGNAFCFISTVLIACQVYRSPKKLRIFIGIFSLLTLPCSIVDTLTFESIISDRWNSLTYLISTFLMMTMHFTMTLDMGFQLRAENASWKHWQVVIGIGGVTASNICILVQIGILGANPLDQFPYKPAFILGVCLACVGDSSVMYYAFAPLVRRKKNRTQPIHSKTTAYGVSNNSNTTPPLSVPSGHGWVLHSCAAAVLELEKAQQSHDSYVRRCGSSASKLFSTRCTARFTSGSSSPTRGIT